MFNFLVMYGCKTLFKDIAREAHCEITMGNDIYRNIHCDVTMSNDIAKCIYHVITICNDVAVNLFCYVCFPLCLIIILLWLVYNKSKNKFMFDRSVLENTFIVFV